jgi:protein arginine N-methyltransferase 1
MIADRVRAGTYLEALRHVVRPGSVVLDLGTGTGFFALFACRLGARRVYAIDPADAICVARELAAANGYADRIEFIQKLSTEVTLPEQVDVIVSDLRGVLPLFGCHLPAIVDARRRFLAPGGTLIPQRDELWAAVAEAPDLYRRQLAPLEDDCHGFDLQTARKYLTNTWSRGLVFPEQLLAEPQLWATLDYSTLETPNVSAAITFPVTRVGTGYGLLAWFDTTLAPGIGFSNAPNAPNAPDRTYGTGFFPWLTPVTLSVGDQVSVTMQADLVGKDYIWRWDTRVLGLGHPRPVKADFRQSTFFGKVLSSDQLRKQSNHHVPVLTEDGQVDQLALALMDGENSLEEIARRVATRFSQRFAKWQDAMTQVGELVQRYSR